MTDNAQPQSGKRFVGDKEMKVHDTFKKLCKIDLEEAPGFDTVDEAHAAHYGNCPKCLGGLFYTPLSYVATRQTQGTTVTKGVPGPAENKMISGPPERK